MGRKKRARTWIIIACIVFFCLVGVYFLLSFYAVKFIQARLQESAGPGLTLSEINVNPLYLGVKGIRYEDPASKKKMVQIDQVRIYPDLFSLLKRTIGIRKLMILKPSVYICRLRDGALVGPWLGGGERKEEEKTTRGEEPGKPLKVEIGQCGISGGMIDFEDRKAGKPPARIELRELDLEMRRIYYPLIPVHSPFRLEGSIKGVEGRGKISMKGWIDLDTTDFEVSLSAEEVDIKCFEPYYRRRVSAEIETGFLDMDCQIVLKKKVIDAPGRMVLKDLRVKEEGSVFWIPATILVPLLKDRGGRIPIKFHLKGNVDDPNFKIQETFLIRIGLAMAEALGMPVKTIEKDSSE